MSDRYEKLDYADRWFFDVLSLTETAGFFVTEEADMTVTKEIIAQMRRQGVKGTYTHIILRATILAFTRHPELNRLILGKQLVYPGSLTIGMTVGDDLSMAGNPSMIFQNAEQKTLMQIAQEVIRRAPEVRAAHHEDRAHWRRAARVIPFSWMRRGLLGMMKSRLSVVKEKTGTFHVTNIQHLQNGVPFMYPGGGALAITRVEDRVVAREGQPTVRPMVTLSMVGDHRIWNANTAAVLLNEIKKILQEGELAAEAVLPTLETSEPVH
jgi:pyruvate dehydrogenase E2 component (dihydrolipoamide acetyltransferase)